MKQSENKCILCGKNYKYCPVCDRSLPAWKSLYDEENCMTIFETTRDYGHKLISAEKAKEILKDCDLSNKSNFRAENKKLLEEILSYGKTQRTITNKKMKNEKIVTQETEIVESE